MAELKNKHKIQEVFFKKHFKNKQKKMQFCFGKSTKSFNKTGFVYTLMSMYWALMENLRAEV